MIRSALTLMLGMTLMAATVDASNLKKSAVTENPSIQPFPRTNSIGMKFVKVPAGTFEMGRACRESDGKDAYKNCLDEGRRDETPGRRVTLGAFWIGQYEVTQAQWSGLMEENPSYFNSVNMGGSTLNFPVESVTWQQIQIFIRRLNAREGEQYRLPTEAEWEYACKSGGKDEKFCGGNKIAELAWYDENGGNRTHQVGTKRPNGLGIYDMSGNVWEWVSDWYGADYYRSSSESNPAGPSGGNWKVQRGGSWQYNANLARAVGRGGFTPDCRSKDLGFRLVINNFRK